MTEVDGETSQHITGAERTDVPGYIDFAMSVGDDDGVTIIRLRGDLDCYSAPQLQAALRALAAEGPRQVIVDVSETNFIDSTALGVLIGAVRRLRMGGGDMVVRSPNAVARRVFEITGATKLFRIV